SEYLNNNLGKSFSKFVNEFRTKEACTLLLQKPYRSILDIGFEVGFRSKTSYHRVFMQNTGLTPSEFRLRGPDSGSNL
ncbi:MAG: AraC family transcriptional regulator, partial [Leptospiraceae bacterium]|nr:AraC family transcriptional regulator [Leptospiraceae bacterium]